MPCECALHAHCIPFTHENRYTQKHTCTHLDTINEIIVKVENVLEGYFDSSVILLVTMLTISSYLRDWLLEVAPP